jgi:hypothetical protein
MQFRIFPKLHIFPGLGNSKSFTLSPNHFRPHRLSINLPPKKNTAEDESILYECVVQSLIKSDADFSHTF